MQRVERMEELFLEPLLTGNELDVIDEEHIDVAVTTSKRAGGVLANGVDIFVHKRLCRHIPHLMVPVVVLDVVANRVEQVGLTETS